MFHVKRKTTSDLYVSRETHISLIKVSRETHISLIQVSRQTHISLIQVSRETKGLPFNRFHVKQLAPLIKLHPSISPTSLAVSRETCRKMVNFLSLSASLSYATRLTAFLNGQCNYRFGFICFFIHLDPIVVAFQLINIAVEVRIHGFARGFGVFFKRLRLPLSNYGA